jgi:hypothetical protein
MPIAPPPLTVSVQELASSLLATTTDEQLAGQLRDLLGRLRSMEITLRDFATRAGDLIGNDCLIQVLEELIKRQEEHGLEKGILTPSRTAHRSEGGGPRLDPSPTQRAQLAPFDPNTGRDMNDAASDPVSSVRFDALTISPG